MASQFSITVRDARADAIETAIGASPLLYIRTGAPPADCAAADTGTALGVMTLPANWMNNAGNGSKTKAGTWSDTSADAAGTMGHFRIYNAANTVCHWQGTITATGGGGDMTVDTLTVVAGQPITVTNFAITEGGA